MVGRKYWCGDWEPIELAAADNGWRPIEAIDDAVGEVLFRRPNGTCFVDWPDTLRLVQAEWWRPLPEGPKDADG